MPLTRRPKSRQSYSPQRAVASDGSLSRGFPLRRALVTALVAVVLLGLLIAVLSFSFKLNAIEFEGRDTQPVKVWNGQANLTVLMLGISRQDAGLQFVDTIHVVYMQPGVEKVTVMAVDPELAVNIREVDGMSLGQSINTIYTLRQLYNYHLINSDPETALQEYIASLQAELGIHVDRYLLLEKDNFSEFMAPFSNIYLELRSNVRVPEVGMDYQKGAQWFGLDQQLGLLANRSVDAASQDELLIRRADIVKRYLLDIGQPLQTLQLGWLLWQTPDMNQYLRSNFSSAELWQLYTFLRGLSDYKIDTAITSAKEVYIFQNYRFLDRSVFDEKIRRLYRNQSVLIEQARVDVINSTNKSGLATRASRLLTNHSFNVVRAGNTSRTYTHHTLYVADPDRYIETIGQLEQFYPDLQIVREEYPDRPTGDMVLVLI